MTRRRMEALRYSAADIAAVAELVFLHLRFHTYKMGWSDSAVRRYVRDAGPLLAELNVLTRCDCTTRDERKAARLAKRMDELEARIDELAAEEELAAIRPELDGRDGDGAPRHAARARWSARRWPSCWRSASTRARSATMKPSSASTRGGTTAPDRRSVSHACGCESVRLTDRTDGEAGNPRTARRRLLACRRAR